MKLTIQIKFLIACTLLVAFTTLATSFAYYNFAKQDTQRESRERIQIAFDIILDDIRNRIALSRQQVTEFLEHDISLRLAASAYLEDTAQVASVSFITSYLKEAVDTLREFGQNTAFRQLSVYSVDQRLLLLYQQQQERTTAGGYLISENGAPSYLPMDDFLKLSPILLGDEGISDTPLPAGISAEYQGDIPEDISVEAVRLGTQFGLRVVVPILHREQPVGMLVCDFFYTSEHVARFAALSKTVIRLHSENDAIGQQAAEWTDCEALLQQEEEVRIFPVTLNGDEYYQGQCVFTHREAVIGSLNIRLTQDIEKARLRQMQITVLTVSGSALLFVFGLSWLLSRKPERMMRNIVSVIEAIAAGDLRQHASIMSRDEFGILALKLNRMIGHVQRMLTQIRNASDSVNTTTSKLAISTRQQEMTMSAQVESTNQVVESVEKISAVAEALVETMQRVASVSQETAGFASRGQNDLSRMEAAIHHMEEASASISGRLRAINEKADNITTVITTITTVADQTNLLSLNAAIEAEKAGEYGRGFTVVASEIRRLADQTAVATLDIEQMVQEMQAAVSAGVVEMDNFVNEVRQSITDVEGISTQLSKIIEQVQILSPSFEDVSIAMQHQSENAQKINEDMVHLSREMQATMESMCESFRLVSQLHDATRELQQEMARFKVD